VRKDRRNQEKIISILEIKKYHASHINKGVGTVLASGTVPSGNGGSF